MAEFIAYSKTDKTTVQGMVLNLSKNFESGAIHFNGSMQVNGTLNPDGTFTFHQGGEIGFKSEIEAVALEYKTI